MVTSWSMIAQGSIMTFNNDELGYDLFQLQVYLDKVLCRHEELTAEQIKAIKGKLLLLLKTEGK